MHVAIRGRAQIRDLARQLREAGRTRFPREMGKAIKAAAEPTLRDLRASALGIDTKGVPWATRKRNRPRRPSDSGHLTGLRQEVADAIVATVSLSGDNPQVRFEVKPGRMSEGRENLPRHLDSPKGWRHPVHGNREVWVRQTGDPWFWEPIKRNIKTFRDGIDRAIGAVVEWIERS